MAVRELTIILNGQDGLPLPNVPIRIVAPLTLSHTSDKTISPTSTILDTDETGQAVFSLLAQDDYSAGGNAEITIGSAEAVEFSMPDVDTTFTAIQLANLPVTAADQISQTGWLVRSTGTLPSTGESLGIGDFDTATGELSIWDGQDWQAIGGSTVIEGPPGRDGQDGQDGEDGVIAGWRTLYTRTASDWSGLHPATLAEPVELSSLASLMIIWEDTTDQTTTSSTVIPASLLATQSSRATIDNANVYAPFSRDGINGWVIAQSRPGNNRPGAIQWHGFITLQDDGITSGTITAIIARDGIPTDRAGTLSVLAQ